MELTTKIERVRELLAQRDEIDRELGDILGGSHDAPPTPRKESAKPRETPKKNVGGRKAGSVHLCSGCGKQGHSIRTCPKARGMHPDNPKPDVTIEIDEGQYEKLRDAMHDREFMSAKYALTNKLSPREVNAAIRSTDYEDYLESR